MAINAAVLAVNANSYDVAAAPITSQPLPSRQLETVISMSSLTIADSTENGGSGAGQATVDEHEAADATTVFRFADTPGLYFIVLSTASTDYFAQLHWAGPGNAPIRMAGSAQTEVIAAEDTGDTGDADITFFGITDLGFVNTVGATITDVTIYRLAGGAVT